MLAALVASLLALLVGAPAAVSAGTSSGRATTVRADGKVALDLAKAFQASDEPQDFWVTFTSTAKTSKAAGVKDWAKRGDLVVDALKATASASQKDTIALLKAQGVQFDTFWITNAIKVRGGSYALAQQLAAKPGVEKVIAPVTYQQPEPVTRKADPKKDTTNTKLKAAVAAASVEWGVANIKADQLWSTYGVRGDGITVANIDTGVQYNHPALLSAYRGYQPDGRIDNDYNWYDVHGSSPFPYDDHGHGTHTMGTMLGDDGAANRTGVAPGAKWIASNGCCDSDDTLLRSSQWMLAPTKIDGTGADPAKRPNVINNSWGTTDPTNDPFLEDLQRAWSDAGIFAVWSNGNIGPNCNTSGSPGSRTLNYSVGAYDSTNTIAGFSSRGSGQDGTIKPNISAPGVAVRSSVPGGRYALYNGTSMAAPHVSGAIALLWSADPSLIGDIARTTALLDDTAIDSPDSQCGGTADDNNVYGEGRLDALSLVQASLQQQSQGTASVTVLDQEGQPVPGASVTLASGQLQRSLRTDADGTGTVEVPAGTYTVTATALDYSTETTTATVTAGQTTAVQLQMALLPGFTVSGTVVDDVTHAPVPGVKVSLTGARTQAVTDKAGRFVIPRVPARSQQLTADGGTCANQIIHRAVSVAGDTTVPTIVLPRRQFMEEEGTPAGSQGTPYGYTCAAEPSTWIAGTTKVEVDRTGITGRTIELPFAFRAYGAPVTSVFLKTTGELYLPRPAIEIPRTGSDVWPYGHMIGLDGDLVAVEESSAVWTRVSGTAPNRTFTIEWRNFGYLSSPARFSVETVLHENGDITFASKGLDEYTDGGTSGAKNMGLRNGSWLGPMSSNCCVSAMIGTSAAPMLRSDDRQLRIDLPDAGTVTGTVTDQATGAPVKGAWVDVVKPDGTILWRYPTDADGRYTAEIFTDRRYTVTAMRPTGYPTAVSKPATIKRLHAARVVNLKLTAATAHTSSEVDLTSGRAATTKITNSGTTAYNWRASITTSGGDEPAVGTQVGRTPLGPDWWLAAAEETDGTWWVSALNLTNGKMGVFETTTDGTPTGRSIALAPIEEALGIPTDSLQPIDLAYVRNRGLLCLTGFTGFTDLACANVATGRLSTVVRTGITPGRSVVGVAYDDAGDRFFVQHNTSPNIRDFMGQTIDTIAGPGRPSPGERLNRCQTAGVSGHGFGYHPGSQLLWVTTSGGLSQIDSASCREVAFLPNEAASANQVQDVTDDGVGVGVLNFSDTILQTALGDSSHAATALPWLKVTPAGTVKPGGSTTLRITVDRKAIPDGVDEAQVRLSGNSGQQQPVIRVRLR